MRMCDVVHVDQRDRSVLDARGDAVQRVVLHCCVGGVVVWGTGVWEVLPQASGCVS